MPLRVKLDITNLEVAKPGSLTKGKVLGEKFARCLSIRYITIITDRAPLFKSLLTLTQS